MPLIVSVLLLAGSQVMYMEAPHYWVMCFARVIQGVRYVIHLDVDDLTNLILQLRRSLAPRFLPSVS
jgi:hypothetical protein